MRKPNDRMSGCRRLAVFLKQFRGDQRGSVAIWVGLSLTVFIGCAGMAVDAARGYMVKARLSQALDASALAGAKALGGDHVTDDINMFFAANFPSGDLDAVVDGPHIDTTNSGANTVKVTAKATIDSTLMSVLGFKTITVGASATAVRGLNGLDVVIAIDMSGSMCDPCTKIEAAETAAKTLVNTLYADPNAKTVTIAGVNYDLLNIGMVPWNAKVNVRYNAAVNNQAYDKTKNTKLMVTSFVNPVTGDPQDHVWMTNVSGVRMLVEPPVGWTGAVYARYIDDYRAANGSTPAVPNDESNDADLKLGYGRFGTKDWMAFEPIPPLEGEPVSGSYPNNNSYGTTWKNTVKQCDQAYWNDNLANVNDRPWDGTPTRPSVPAQPAYWVVGNPSQGSATGSDCTKSLTHGILPLQGVKDAASKQLVLDAIDGLYTGTSKPDGNTNAPQGLYWAWEVLMSGEPFSQAKSVTPFTRTQAIVLLTDGAITGENGDAYKGVFGPDSGAGTTNKHGIISTGVNNNLNNRLLKLASNIKGADPAQGVKIYVVQYDEPSASLKTLLQKVATETAAPYYYQASDSAGLQTAFQKIAASLSVLRLAQ